MMMERKLECSEETVEEEEEEGREKQSRRQSTSSCQGYGKLYSGRYRSSTFLGLPGDNFYTKGVYSTSDPM